MSPPPVVGHTAAVGASVCVEDVDDERTMAGIGVCVGDVVGEGMLDFSSKCGVRA